MLTLCLATLPSPLVDLSRPWPASGPAIFTLFHVRLLTSALGCNYANFVTHPTSSFDPYDIAVLPVLRRSHKRKRVQSIVLGVNFGVKKQASSRKAPEKHVEPAIASDKGACDAEVRDGDSNVGHGDNTAQSYGCSAHHVDYGVEEEGFVVVVVVVVVAMPAGLGFGRRPLADREEDESVEDASYCKRYEDEEVVQGEAERFVSHIDPAPCCCSHVETTELSPVLRYCGPEDGHLIVENPEENNGDIYGPLRWFVVPDDSQVRVDSYGGDEKAGR